MEKSGNLAVPMGAPRVPLPLAMFGDARLARLVSVGDERAFAKLFERYHQPLYRYCRSLVRNEEDAQDALQATMTNALVALRRAPLDAPLRPWLYRIAHNESISLLRRRRPADQTADGLLCPSHSPEDRFAERERLGMLVADLQELPELQRGALVMRELGGLSHEEISAALKISPAAVKQTIFEARRGLSEFAEGRAMTCEDVLRIVSDGDRRKLRGRRVAAHLRDCPSCAAFAAAIPARRAELAALAPPLAPLIAAGMVSRILRGSPGHGVGVASAGVAQSAGAVVAVKALVGVAAIAAAAAGAVGVLKPAHHHLVGGVGAAQASRAVGLVDRRAPNAAAVLGAHRGPRQHRHAAHSDQSLTPVGQALSANGLPISTGANNTATGGRGPGSQADGAPASARVSPGGAMRAPRPRRSSATVSLPGPTLRAPGTQSQSSGAAPAQSGAQSQSGSLVQAAPSQSSGSAAPLSVSPGARTTP